jgi:hypothetical protein
MFAIDYCSFCTSLRQRKASKNPFSLGANAQTVRLEFMTDDVNEAEEIRIQWLAFDCVAEVRILD